MSKLTEIKIYFPLLCFYPSQAGGPANTIYWLTEELAKSGFSCFVTSTKFGLEKLNITLTNNLYHSENKVDFVKGFINFFSLNQLNKILKSDAIHFSSLFFAPTIFLVFISHVLNKKIVISPRGELYPDALNKSQFIKRFYLKLFSFFESRIVFHATNEIELKHINSIFPKSKNVFIFPNLMPISKNSELGNNGQVLFLGRLNEIKNLDKLIEAIFLLEKIYKKKVILNIAGEARIEREKKYEKYLLRLIEKYELQQQIIFLGQVTGKRKSFLLNDSCCLVLPSKSENFGNVVIEALSKGTPVISSKGTPWSSLEREGIGFWINSNSEEIAEKINYYLTLDKDQYFLVSAKAKRYVYENFDISLNINSWKKFYKDL